MAAAAIGLAGFVFPGFGFLASLVLGTLAELDPTLPVWLGHVSHVGVMLLFTGFGALIGLVSLVAAVGLLVRKPWARPLGIGLSVLACLVGLFPLGLVALFALFRPEVGDAFAEPG